MDRMRNSWINDLSGSIWPAGVQFLEARTDRAAQGDMSKSALTLGPQQRVSLVHFPDSLTIPRKGIFELFGCAYRDETSAPATLLPLISEYRGQSRPSAALCSCGSKLVVKNYLGRGMTAAGTLGGPKPSQRLAVAGQPVFGRCWWLL